MPEPTEAFEPAGGLVAMQAFEWQAERVPGRGADEHAKDAITGFHTAR